MANTTQLMSNGASTRDPFVIFDGETITVSRVEGVWVVVTSDGEGGNITFTSTTEILHLGDAGE